MKLFGIGLHHNGEVWKDGYSVPSLLELDYIVPISYYFVDISG